MCPWYVFTINCSGAVRKPVPWCKSGQDIRRSYFVALCWASCLLFDCLWEQRTPAVSTAHSQLQDSHPMQKSDQQSKAKMRSNKQNKMKQNNDNKKSKKQNPNPSKKQKEMKNRVVLNYIREVCVPLPGRRLLCIECFYWEMLMGCPSEVQGPDLTSYFFQQSHNSALQIISSASPH